MPLFGKDDKFNRMALSTALKMSTSRLSMQKNKKENHVKMQKREVAQLLQNGKEESARIKIEAVLRDQYMVEGMELLQLFLDLVNTRLQLIVESRSCPTDMKEAISTIIWATPRVENVPELLQIRDQLARKFGKEFAQKASENAEGAVHQRTLFRLSMQVPEPYLCVQAMQAIAAEYQVEWSPKPDLSDPIHGLGSGTGVLPDPVQIQHQPHHYGAPPAGPGHYQPTAPPPPQMTPQHVTPTSSLGYIPSPPPFDPSVGLPPPIFPQGPPPSSAPPPVAPTAPPVVCKEAAPLPPPMPDYNHYPGAGGAAAAGDGLPPAGGAPGGLQAQQNADFLDLETRLNNLKRGNP